MHSGAKKTLLAALALTCAIPAATLAQSQYQYNHPTKPFLFTQANANVTVAGKPTNGPDGPMRDGAWMVSAAGIRDVFENITHGSMPTVRHKPSGLVCKYPGVVFAPKSTDASKFDPSNLTGCINRMNGFQVDTEVGLNNSHIGIRPAMKSLIAEFEVEQQGLSEEGERVTPTTGDVLDSAHASGQLILSTGDEPKLTYLSIAALGDWIFVTKTRCWSDQTWLCRQIGDFALRDAIASRRP